MASLIGVTHGWLAWPSRKMLGRPHWGTEGVPPQRSWKVLGRPPGSRKVLERCSASLTGHVRHPAGCGRPRATGGSAGLLVDGRCSAGLSESARRASRARKVLGRPHGSGGVRQASSLSDGRCAAAGLNGRTVSGRPQRLRSVCCKVPDMPRARRRWAGLKGHTRCSAGLKGPPGSQRGHGVCFYRINSTLRHFDIF